MIFPKKHLTIYESLIGLSSYILNSLKSQKMDIDQIWKSYKKLDGTKAYPAKHNFDDVVLAIDILFSLKKIDLNNGGKLILNETD